MAFPSFSGKQGFWGGVYPRPASESTRERPGRVQALRGVIFQSDAGSDMGAWCIRPFEALDRRVAGLHRSGEPSPLAMHAGIRVALEDGREFVAEQLIVSLSTLLRSGLCWTPLEAFRQRDRRGVERDGAGYRVLRGG